MNRFYSTAQKPNSFILANKRAKNLCELVARADPYNIKTDHLDQTDRGYKKCGRKCDSCNNFLLKKTTFVRFATKFSNFELNLRFAEIALVI